MVSQSVIGSTTENLRAEQSDEETRSKQSAKQEAGTEDTMTEAERIVAWAERHANCGELPAKRPQGRAGHLRHEDKQPIRLAYLEGGGRVTRLALAAQFNVNRDTVAACLQGKEFEELQHQLEQELRRAAFDRLKANVLPAANAWVDSLDVAAQKGDHRPAKELLLHTNVIAPLRNDEGSGITVHIGGHAADVKVGIAVSSASDPSPLSKITG